MVSFILLLAKISDPDFFWHLKTGELIWQQRSLPAEDPFSYTSQGLQDGRTHLILTGYWFGEVIFHLLYAEGGMSWIVGLRFVLIGMLICVMLKRKRGDFLLYMGFLLMFLSSFLKTFPIERPQVFSFLFFALLLRLLESIRDGVAFSKMKWIYFVFPLLMLTWANTHPGFVLGLTAIAVYIVVEGVKFLHPTLRPMKTVAYKRLALIGVSGILVSMLNPNSYNVFAELKLPVSHTSTNIEYLSTLESFRTFSGYGLILYWIILLLTIFGFIYKIRKVDITELVLLAGTGYFSFTTMRYVPIFLIAALPAVSSFFSEGRLLKPARIFVIMLSIISAIFFIGNGRANLTNITSGNWINSYMFPVAGAEFIIENDLKGNIYNPDYWGGYLIWKLAPWKKVFIDGRALNFLIYNESLGINNAELKEIAGMPAWKAILGAYNVNYVLTPFSRLGGGLVPLVSALLDDRDWRPVFASFNSVIFVKDLPLNSDVVNRYAISKGDLIDFFFTICNRQISTNPNNIDAYITKGDLFIDESRAREARHAYEKALQIMPLNTTAAERLKILDMKRTD
jgi:hypothetical protein